MFTLLFYIFMANSWATPVLAVPNDLSRITGGVIYDDRHYSKHIVSIRTAKPKRYYGDNHFCGGTIISPDLILTAGHCLIHGKSGKQKEPSELLVVAGSIYRLKQTPEAVMLHVRQVVVHGGYSRRSIEFDIGILKLQEQIIEDNNHTQRLAVTKKPLEKSTVCTILGWGRVISDGPTSPILLYANVTIWPLGKCKKVFPNMYFSPGIVCASDEYDWHLTKASCQGDSGGPLICNSVLAGIVSFGGQFCGQKGVPTAYTDAYFFRRWIEKNAASTLATDFGAIILIINFHAYFV